MIVLFTDFGTQGPYLGQMEAVLRLQAPGINVINLLSDAPACNPKLSSYLLSSFTRYFPDGTVFLCVVDPGVGSKRPGVVLKADTQWFVGPENGLLNTVACHTKKKQWWRIDWLPEDLSETFHGRDLFAPVAAKIANRDFPEFLVEYAGPDLNHWSDDIATIIYVDHYGNALTGWRYSKSLDHKMLLIDKQGPIFQASTFSGVRKGMAFWYQNSCGLIEIAVNQGRADQQLGLVPGKEFCFG